MLITGSVILIEPAPIEKVLQALEGFPEVTFQVKSESGTELVVNFEAEDHEALEGICERLKERDPSDHRHHPHLRELRRGGGKGPLRRDGLTRLGDTYLQKIVFGLPARSKKNASWRSASAATAASRSAPTGRSAGRGGALPSGPLLFCPRPRPAISAWHVPVCAPPVHSTAGLRPGTGTDG